MRKRPVVADLVSKQPLPRMFQIRQKFRRERIPPEDIPATIERLLREEKFISQIRPGMRVAITAGSREIGRASCRERV